MARPHRRALAFLGSAAPRSTRRNRHRVSRLACNIRSRRSKGQVARQRVAAGPMLKIGARLCLSGCQQETCVPGRLRIPNSSWSTRPRAGFPTYNPIEEKIMSKVLVLYYSAYGHVEAMANAVAEGARQAGEHVDIKRVPELVPRRSHASHITSSIRWRRSQRSMISLPTTRSSSVPAPGSGDCRRRWPISSTRPGDFGRAEHCTARSAARFRRAPRTWRPGDDAVLDHHQPSALRHGDCGPRLRPCRTDDA